MTLEKFGAEMHLTVEKFKVEWEKRNKKRPKEFPSNMEEADWENFFLDWFVGNIDAVRHPTKPK